MRHIGNISVFALVFIFAFFVHSNVASAAITKCSGQPTSTINWSSSGSITSCTPAYTSGCSFSPSLTGPSSGSQPTTLSSGTCTATFSCTGPGGTTVRSDTLTIDTTKTWNGSACVTPTPPSGTISTSPNPCTIAIGGSTCSTTITWSTANTPSASVYAGAAYMTGGLSGSSVAPWMNGNNSPLVFSLKDSNNNQLSSVTANAVCAVGSTWNGNICAASACGNGANNPPTCTTFSPCANGANNPPTCTTFTPCANGANNPPTCTTFNPCANGATNPPTCTTFTPCANGATNPPTCTTFTPCANGATNPPTCTTFTPCANGANNPPTCTTCTAPLVWNAGTLTCVAAATPLGILVSPSAYSATLPNSTVTAGYTLANGTSSNTTCRLLDNAGSPLSAYNTCLGYMVFTAPAVASAYAYYIQAYKASTGETVTSNIFTVNIIPAPVSNTPPTGVIDSASSGTTCGLVSGWAFDPDFSSKSINVHVYVDGPAGSGIGYDTGPTIVARPDVNTAYGITGVHGYSYQLPSLAVGTHTVYAYGIGVNNSGVTDGGNFPALSNSPTTFTCSALLPCTLPWGGSIASGVSVQAFPVGSVRAPATCPAAQTRTCTNGTLSGTYQYSNCSALNPTVTISTAQARVRSGGSTTVVWSSTDVTSCDVARNGVASWRTTTSSLGTSDIVRTQTTYVITCQTTGSPVTASTTVNVVPTFNEF